ncbi:MAG: MerR family transcriptional regulator [Candidatus Moduliflexus flocculans]|nr:MerR family transcriptional regulator [Candidatus Moduliflexus flocculans]
MKNRYLVREFAKLTRVTVRTLHYYDQIGLLEPSFERPNGYRVYTDADLLKLQQIVTLKFMGFSLDEIRRLLEAKATRPRRPSRSNPPPSRTRSPVSARPGGRSARSWPGSRRTAASRDRNSSRSWRSFIWAKTSRKAGMRSSFRKPTSRSSGRSVRTTHPSPWRLTRTAGQSSSTRSRPRSGSIP